MYTIIGLGNPGDEYKKTRHNAGRIALESIAKKRDFSEWKKDLKLKALVATGMLGKKKVSFILPETFMNNSGISVKPLVKSKKDLTNIVILNDDLDIPLGKIKISFDKSAGGHNGVASIVKAVKAQEFTRVRIGVSPSTAKGAVRRPDSEKLGAFLVEKDLRENEYAELKKAIKKIDEALVVLVNDGRGKAMSEFN